jgi:hypothetical protein
MIPEWKMRRKFGWGPPAAYRPAEYQAPAPNGVDRAAGGLFKPPGSCQYGSLYPNCPTDFNEKIRRGVTGTGEVPGFVETGDLPEIRERGQIRVLLPAALPHLPRGRGVEGRESALIDGLGPFLWPAATKPSGRNFRRRMAAGEYDLTVADSHILDVERAWREDVRGVPTLGEPVARG